MQKSVQTDYYEKNLEALRKHSPIEAKLLESHAAGLELFVDVIETQDYVLFYKKDGIKTPFHNIEVYHRNKIFSEMVGSIKKVEDQKMYLGTFAFLFCGLDAGIRLSYFFYHTPFQCTIYVIERHIEVLRAIVKQFDITEIINSGRLFLFCGPDADQRLFDRIDHIEEKPAKIPFWFSAVYREEEKQYYTNILSKATSVAMKVLTELPSLGVQVEAYYKNLKKADLAENFNPSQKSPSFSPRDECSLEISAQEGATDFGPRSSTQKNSKLTVLSFVNKNTSVMQHVTRDCMDALCRIGHNAVIIDEEGPVSMYFYYKIINKYKPNLIFFINHFISEIFPPIDNLISITWVQDHMKYIFDGSIPHDKKINRYDQILVLTKYFMNELLNLGFPAHKLHRFYFGANTQKYYPIALSDQDRSQYACDVSLVSNYSSLTNAVSLIPADFAQELYKIMCESHEYFYDTFVPLFDSLAAKRGGINVDRGSLITYIWADIARAAIRIPYLEAITDLKLHIYGKGWEEDLRFKPFAKGFATNGEQVCKIYNASKINLNTHLSNNNPRVFDIIASGGFLLTRFNPEDEGPGGIGDLFKIGEEIEIFRTKEEMRSKIEYYLRHDDERSAIAKRGYHRLLKEHTMEHRMQQAFDIVYNGLLQ